MALGRSADMFQGEAFWHAQKAVKSPRTPLGELTTLPRSPGQLERGMGDSPSPVPTPTHFTVDVLLFFLALVTAYSDWYK